MGKRLSLTLALGSWAALMSCAVNEGVSSAVPEHCRSEPGCGAGFGTCYVPPGCSELVCLCDPARPAPGRIELELDPEPTEPTEPTFSPALVLVEPTPQGVRLLERPMVYRFGEGIVDPSSMPILEELARVLEAYPDRNLRIEVHSDAKGAAASNLRLTQVRAEAVRARLIELGVAAERLEALGVGEDQPISHPAPPQGQRRTEFHWQ